MRRRRERRSCSRPAYDKVLRDCRAVAGATEASLIVLQLYIRAGASGRGLRTTLCMDGGNVLTSWSSSPAERLLRIRDEVRCAAGGRPYILHVSAIDLQHKDLVPIVMQLAADDGSQRRPTTAHDRVTELASIYKAYKNS